MGGTLDNGIYLPDQGERNCYNGLKNNWDTLDNLIETVQALSSAGLTREIVNSLPTDNIKTNVIYMLRNSQQSGDLYDEYMYINNAWEPIGTSATEMDNYYTKSETNALPAVASGITASKVTGYDSHVANTEVHITAAERSTWNGKQNALDTDQTAAVNSGVNATKVTGYDTHVADTVIHVTSSDKTAWSAKQDGLSQTQLNAVNSGVTDTKVTGYDTHVADSSAHVSSSDRTAWNGKQDALSQTQLNNIAAVPDKANSADLATVATTGDYGDLLNAPTIPTVNNATLTIQKNGTDVATFTANASSNVTANLSIPTDTSDLTNGAGFLTQHNPIDNKLSVSSENAVQNKVVTTALNGKAASSHTHAAGDINSGTFNIARIPDLDASKITSGTIDIARLPKGSLERLVKVADQAARFALTTDDVQLGDTVQQLDTGVMYVVTDESKLSSADGYTEYTAGSATSVPWSGVTGKPSSYTPASHTHGNVTNDGKLPTASRALITDSSKNITVSSVSDTELGYLSGVTSAIQTQLNGKAASNHVHGNITNDGKVGTTANKPLITGTGGVVQAGSFGTAANTFCEGNDSRLSDARTPVAHTHVTSDVTDLLSDTHTWTSQQSYNSDLNLNYASTDVDDIVNSVAGSATLDNFVHMTGNETVNGIKSFPDGVIANVTGSATSATNDGSGNVISTTYGKLGAGNEWTGNNKFTSQNSNFGFKSTTAESGSTTLSSNWIYWQDKNGFQDAYISRDIWNNGADSLRLSITGKRSNGVPSTSGTGVECGVRLDLYADGERHFNPFGDGVTNLGGEGYRWKNVYSVSVLGDVFETYPGSTGLVLRSTDQTWENGSRIFLYSNTHTGQTNGSIYVDVDHGDENHTKSGVVLVPGVFFPVASGTNGVKLGDSTHKWKSFNGLNPGALSLATTDTSKIDYFNGDITDKTGGANNKTFAVDGWITVIIPNVSGDFIAIDNSIGQTVSISGTGVGHSSIDISCPVRAGVQVTILCKCSGGSVIAAHTWCEGNV